MFDYFPKFLVNCNMGDLIKNTDPSRDFLNEPAADYEKLKWIY
jgi:hypothetical protein